MFFYNTYPHLRGMFFKVKNENTGGSFGFIVKKIKEIIQNAKSPIKVIAICKEILSYCLKAGGVTGARDKATGLIPGVSDMIMLTPRSGAIFIEFKTEKGKQSEKQKEWQKKIEYYNYKYYIIRKLENFKTLCFSLDL